MTGQGPGFAGQNTSLVGQKRKKGRESDRPGQALARQNPKFVGRLTDDWLLFAGLFKGNRKRFKLSGVRVIGSSKKIAGSKEKNHFTAQ